MDDLDVASCPAGSRLRLRVKPGARADTLIGVHAGALKLSVTAPPERGKANRAVGALLAAILDIPVSAVSIVAGETSQNKIAEVGLDPAAVRSKLAARWTKGAPDTNLSSRVRK